MSPSDAPYADSSEQSCLLLQPSEEASGKVAAAVALYGSTSRDLEGKNRPAVQGNVRPFLQ